MTLVGVAILLALGSFSDIHWRFSWSMDVDVMLATLDDLLSLLGCFLAEWRLTCYNVKIDQA